MTLNKRVFGAINGVHRVPTNQLAIAVHHIMAAALLPLLTPRPVHPGHVEPGQTWQIVVHQVQVQIQEQPGPWPAGFIKHRTLFGTGCGAVLVKRAEHADRQHRTVTKNTYCQTVTAL